MRLYHIIAAATMLLCEAQTQCIRGQVRLVGGSGPHEGRVEVCVNCHWGTVCDDLWDNNDASVVCRQLGYTSKGAQALFNASFGQGTGFIVLDNVQCNSSLHHTLLQCPRQPLYYHNCYHSEDAGVRCGGKMVKSVDAVNFTTPNYSTLHTFLMRVTFLDVTRNESFQVGCYSQQHSTYVAISVSNVTHFTTQLGGLFPSSFYNCCATANYNNQQHVAGGLCISVETPGLLTTVTTVTEGSDLFTSTGSLSSASNLVDLRTSNQVESKYMTSVSLVGGILGLIITVLLILLLLSVIALVCQLQPNLKKIVIPKTSIRSTTADLNPNTSALPAEQIFNPTYTTTPQSLNTAGSSDRQDYEHEDYSRLQY